AAHADQAASRTRGRSFDHPQGLCRGAATGGIFSLRDRREFEARDRYAESVGREPSATAILRACAGNRQETETRGIDPGADNAAPGSIVRIRTRTACAWRQRRISIRYPPPTLATPVSKRCH